MRIHNLTSRDWLKALSAGLATAVLLSAIMVPAMKLGLSPLPQPLGLAFAEAVLGRPLPLPVGLLFHLVYVTFWSLAFIVLFRTSLRFGQALLLALILWLGVLLAFFPIAGWGLLGLGVGPKLLVAAFMLHVLFATFLWGFCRLLFGQAPDRQGE